MAPTPGWYDDPAGGDRLRWWDGDGWTDQTRPRVEPVRPPADSLGSGLVLTPPDAPAPADDETAGQDDGPSEPSASSAGTSPASSLFGDKAGDQKSPLAATVASGRDEPTPLLPLNELYSDANLPEGGDKVVEIPGTDGIRNRRTPIFVAGVLLLMIGVVAGVALTRQAGNVFDLQVGDCINDLDRSGAGTVTDVPTVDCELPHDSEVFAIHGIESPQFPGSATLEALVDTICVDRFRDAVGYPLELTQLDVAAIRPSATTWNSGDRELVCYLERADGAKLVGSKIGLAEGEGKAVFQLREGDCFDAPLTDAEPGTEVQGVAIVDCSLPHFGQVYEVAQLAAGPYPGRDQLVDDAQSLCLEAFTPYVGQPFEESLLWFNALPPTESSWEAGDREVVCYVNDPINGQIVGEAREWARQHSDDVLEFGEGYDVTGLVVGDCFDDPPSDGGSPEGIPVETIPCAEPHDNEVFLSFDLDEGAWPGATRLTETVDDRCAPAFQEYVGTDRIDLTWFAFQPTQDTWGEGDRRVVCALYDVDFLKIRGSQRQSPV